MGLLACAASCASPLRVACACCTDCASWLRVRRCARVSVWTWRFMFALLLKKGVGGWAEEGEGRREREEVVGDREDNLSYGCKEGRCLVGEEKAAVAWKGEREDARGGEAEEAEEEEREWERRFIPEEKKVGVWGALLGFV